MDTVTAVLDSWDRQCRIVRAVASKVDESNRKLKPSPDGWPLDHQLAHIHLVRMYWTKQFSSVHAESVATTFVDGWETPIQDLDVIKSCLIDSDKAVRSAAAAAFSAGTGASGGYDNPVLFLQHMIWHEGWHVGLMFLALRLGGQEPPDEWQEANVWSEWRTEL